MRPFWILAIALPLMLRAETEEEALFLRRIADFWQEGEYQIAKTQMEEFIVDYPQSPFADALCAALGDLFLREKNYSSALSYYSQVQSPEFIKKVFLHRMQCLYEMQWYATLADECEVYLETEPNLHVTYFLAVALYHQCMNASKETDQFLKLAERAKPYFEALYQSELSQEIAQGYAHLSCILKDYAKATEIYADLAEKNPAIQEEMLFQVALIQSEYDKALALQTFDKISSMGRKRAKEAAYNRMVLAFDLGRYEEIVKGDLIKQVPEDRAGIARLFLGRSFIQTKQYPEAAQELKAYIQSAPVSETLFAALLSLLDASYQAGDLQSLDEAIAKLALHYPQNPELPKAYFSRAQILKKNECFDEAKKELDRLVAEYPAFPQKPQVMFELAHLDFKARNWEDCYDRGLSFLRAFPEHELSPFVWRYFISASSEIAIQKPEHKPQLIADLQGFLEGPLSDLEKSEWQLLQAKTYFELKEYESAIHLLKSQDTPNARLLLSLCYRDGYRDIEQFCQIAEEALLKGANLVASGQIHASLYNAYLELSDTERAAQHLYEAFMAKADLKIENLLWLADHYYHHVIEEEGNFVIAARAAALYLNADRKMQPGDKEQVLTRLAKLYSMLGRIDDAIALLDPLPNPSQETQLILAENYAKKGVVDQAIQMFDAIVNACGTGRSPVAAAAALHGARLKMKQAKPDLVEIAMQLKNLVLQKNFEGEPLYLEAALDYVQVAAKNDPMKKAALLQKTKEDFQQRNDLLAKDYHAAREKSPRKNITYQGYMKLIDAEIALSGAKSDPLRKEDLQEKSKTLLLEIMEAPIASCLKERVQKLLADET